MKYHILTGDALATTFRRANIDGNQIVCRECLIDGPVSDDDLDVFWRNRSGYILGAFDSTEYLSNVKSEFDKINNVTTNDEINLWFENDLFCQANMWFTISLLNKRGLTNVFRVSPLVRNASKWEGFGRHKAHDLVHCVEQRQPFAKGDFKLGGNLWDAYRKEDLVALAFLSKSLSPCFSCLEEVCKAEIERKRSARPRRVLEDLLAKGYTDFSDIFTRFSQTEGIYGFGDLQVGNMLKEIKE